MILIDKQIRELAKDKHLIEPFREEMLQSESYDVTLGEVITKFRKEIHCIDIEDQSTINNIYEDINISERGYIISPKEYIMISLEEKITLPNNVSAHIMPKTKYTRLGLIISAQHCNSTYSGKLRLGLFNATDYPIRIYAGKAVAQLIFDELSDVPSEEKQYTNKEDASYQNEDREFRGAKFSDERLEKVWKEILE